MEEIDKSTTFERGFFGKSSFFYGANSENGFISYGKDLTDDGSFDRIIYVMGGPGTGKSSLMRAVSNYAVSQSIGCEKYFCSSDPSSLDAIRLFDNASGKKVFICDATSPHPREYSTPGAVGVIADLSAFWSSEMLSKNKTHVIKLQNEKKKHFNAAYGFLRLCGKTVLDISVLKKYYDCESLERKVSELLRKAAPDGGTVWERPVSCISMFGEKTLNNRCYGAKNTLRLGNNCDFSVIFFELLITECKKRGISFLRSPNPISPNRTEEIFVPSASLFVSVISDECKHKLQAGRYLREETAKELSKITKASFSAFDEYKNAALRELALAKDCHFALERMYGAAMDFEAKERFDKSIVKIVSDIFQK
ncbi:MAG: hypothetical protein E7619_02835 [Ruminococcaceae bacterium]|nr:hypothetical protein [Oscillospiraceae bacterium]